MSYTREQKRKIWEDIKANHPDFREFIETMNREFGPIELSDYKSETLEMDDGDNQIHRNR